MSCNRTATHTQTLDTYTQIDLCDKHAELERFRAQRHRDPEPQPADPRDGTWSCDYGTSQLTAHHPGELKAFRAWKRGASWKEIERADRVG